MDMQIEEIYALIETLSISVKEKADLKKIYDSGDNEAFIIKIRPLLDSEEAIIDTELARLDIPDSEEQKYATESEAVEASLDNAFDDIYRIRIEEPEAQIEQVNADTLKELDRIDKDTQKKLKDLEKEFRAKINNAEIDKVKEDLKKL